MLDAMLSAKEFCDLMDEALAYKAPGYWYGSAYRAHPRGLMVDNIRFVSAYNTNNYCSISITDGGWNMAVCKDSCASGNPYPQAMGGKIFDIWRDGKVYDTLLWPILEAKILSIISDTQKFIEKAKEEKERETLLKKETEKNEMLFRKGIALSKILGS